MTELTSLNEELLLPRIQLIRGAKVMLDFDLADLYQVETKQLKRAVRRNIQRFPADFMFELNPVEWDILRCQTGTSNWGGTRFMPMAFTEQGVAMLSSVLSSDRAIGVNIAIMRVFVRMRKVLEQNRDLYERIDRLEKSLMDSTTRHDEEISILFQSIRDLMTGPPQEKERKKIGFNPGGNNFQDRAQSTA